MSEFYHIMVSGPNLGPNNTELNREFNRAIDWYRYENNCWIVYTTSDAKKWHERLGPIVKKNDGRLFICRLDVSDRQGWIGKGLWEWLRKDRDD